MAIQVSRPSKLKYLKALIFSPAGHGKTTLLGTAQHDERTYPMLLLDFEGGLDSLSGLDIDVVLIRSWDDYNEVFEKLANGRHWELPGSSLEKGETYKSLGIDSISETHIFALLTILHKEGPNRKDPELLEQRDYGKATVQMRRLLREFRDLPMHVFYTSHAKEVEIPRMGRVQVPSLSGQMAEEAAGLMSVVGYLAETEEPNEETEELETHRVLLLKNYAKFRTKARTPFGVVVPDEIMDPTVTSILDTLGYSSNGDGAEFKARAEASEEPEQEPEEEQQQEDEPENVDDLDAMKASELRDLALEHEIDLGDARTKSQIVQVIRKAWEEQDANDG